MILKKSKNHLLRRIGDWDYHHSKGHPILLRTKNVKGNIYNYQKNKYEDEIACQVVDGRACHDEWILIFKFSRFALYRRTQTKEAIKLEPV